MSYWPDVEDRRWPDDMPKDYFITPELKDGISWWGLRAVVIGLCRRVEFLETRVRDLENQQ